MSNAVMQTALIVLRKRGEIKEKCSLEVTFKNITIYILYKK